MNSFSAARVPVQSYNTAPPVVHHDVEIVHPVSGSDCDCRKPAAPIHIKIQIAKLPQPRPSREYQQSACHSLLADMLDTRPYREIYPCKGRQWLVVKSKSGAPRMFFAGVPAEVNVSLAHSGPWIGVALALGANIGIDVEQMKPRENVAAMAEYMGWADRVLDTNDFLSRWTLWEACVKLEEASIFSRNNPAFDALGRLKSDGSLLEAGRWAGLKRRMPEGAHFALAIDRKCQVPLEIKLNQGVGICT